jgi:hypothetical protein
VPDRLITRTHPSGGLSLRYKDMGDGTFAEVVYLAGGTTGGTAAADVVAIKDGVDTERKLVVDSQGRIAIIGTVTIANPTANPETGLAKESTLAALLTELGQKLEPGQAVALDAATLAALETINAVVSGTVAVSNFPASQPVTGPLTDAQLRAAAVPVSGFPATQAVSGTVAVSNPTPAPVATAGVTATGAAGAAVTLTLPAPGAGLFHHIVSLEVTAYNTAARTGTATPVLATTTNLPGAPVVTLPSAGAVGATDRYSLPIAAPLKATAAATATTVVCPATASVIWRVTATYYTA